MKSTPHAAALVAGAAPDPLPDLEVLFKKVKLKNKHGRVQLVVKLRAENNGLLPSGACAVDLYLSDAPVLDSTSMLLVEKPVPGLNAYGAKKAKAKLEFEGGEPLAGKFLIAVIDGQEEVEEFVEENNTAVFGLE